VRTASLVALVIVLAAGAGTAGFFETRALRSHRDPAPSASAAPTAWPAALSAATAAPAPVVTAGAGQVPAAAAVARALATPVRDPALGSRLLAQVIDVDSGTSLFADRPGTPAAPASTAKLLTAAAVLAAYPGTHRFTTSVAAGAGGALVLVGGGDPTLTAAAAGKAADYPGAARISDLAAQLHGVPVTRIVVDDSLFAGPSVSPDWAAEDVPSSYASAITAVLADGGRARPGDAIRSAAPDLAAGHALAAALGHADLPVTRGAAPSGARTLATVRSAPLRELVEQMLQQSDNVIAEVLARQVAVARHLPASFTGAAAAVRAEMAGLGVQVGAGLRDGSGLAAADRVSPAALVAVLRLAATGPAGPRALLAGLPVAAWSGTLADRYLGGRAVAAGAGAVRAKTGTLTGVSSLAGVVHTRDGRLLAFALIADRVPPGAAATDAADAALDAIAATLARCGCS